MRVRCFDLGGSGLKTCVFSNDVIETKPELLGKSPSNDVAKWIREVAPSLEKEIAGDTAFSFSLAGLDKLTTTKNDFGNRRDVDSIAALFSLPSGRVFTLNDGDAHLFASRELNGIAELPHLNCAVGTGVAFGIYDSEGQVLSERALFDALKCAPWDLRVSCSATNTKVHHALSGDGLNELENTDKDHAIERFEKRWLKFFTEVLFLRIKDTPLMPKVISMTGGVSDSTNLWTKPSELLGCKLVKGPKDGGLQGARLYALRSASYLSTSV